MRKDPVPPCPSEGSNRHRRGSTVSTCTGWTECRLRLADAIWGALFQAYSSVDKLRISEVFCLVPWPVLPSCQASALAKEMMRMNPPSEAGIL